MEIIKLVWPNCKPKKTAKLEGKRSINDRSSQEGHGNFGGAVAHMDLRTHITNPAFKEECFTKFATQHVAETAGMWKKVA